MVLRIVTLVLTPIALALLNLAHPLIITDVPLYRQIAVMPQRWFALHLAQLPLLALLSLGLVLLTEGFGSGAAKVSRVAGMVVGITYTAMNAILGIALALLVRYGEAAPVGQQETIAAAVEAVWNNRLVGAFSLLTVTAGLAWMVAVIAAALTLRTAQASAGALAFIVTGAFLFGLGHMRPFGPLGMTLFALGMLWLHMRPQARRLAG